MAKGISGTACQWFDRSFKVSWGAETWLFISLLHVDGTQLYLSFHPDDLTISAHISACLTDISCWMKDHHLQLNLAKTELLVVSTNQSLHHSFTIQLCVLTTRPSRAARNLGAVINDRLNFSDHIAKTAKSCRFA
ncbi:6-carboxyhexanoate--CoA ligase [Labeo rohita]|uniref:6-carboxyhexanoate--CoA ligase n=1 Tax=Labeo rohita TaxID=84645 RepID=A0ABQ8LF37_LABRO|nr:6-carboxyhexanoate--CoA ligase [Labeo rohita]